MTCAECQDLLLDLAYGELAPLRAAEVEAHVQGCASCLAERALLEGTRRAMAPLRALEEPPARFDGAILAAARAEAALVADGTPGPVIEAVAQTQAASLRATRVDAGAKVRPLQREPRWAMRVALGGSIAAAAALALVVSTKSSRPDLSAPADETAYQIRVRGPAEVAAEEASRAAAKTQAEHSAEHSKDLDRAAEQRRAQAAPPPPSAASVEKKAVPAEPDAPPNEEAAASKRSRKEKKSAAAFAQDDAVLNEPYEGSGGDGFDSAAKDSAAQPGLGAASGGAGLGGAAVGSLGTLGTGAIGGGAGRATASGASSASHAKPAAAPALAARAPSSPVATSERASPDPEVVEKDAAAARLSGNYPLAAQLFHRAAELRLHARSSDHSTTAWDLAHAVQCLASAGSFDEARTLRSELARYFPGEAGPIAAAQAALLHAPQPLPEQSAQPGEVQVAPAAASPPPTPSSAPAH